mmetsp:Transcript_696/g.1089  ORF Transcript_696/g.1089 Transcript_696/m.1089 type:complete len:641 (+) Transcript_696:22-1944(+)
MMSQSEAKKIVIQSGLDEWHCLLKLRDAVDDALYWPRSRGIFFIQLFKQQDPSRMYEEYFSNPKEIEDIQIAVLKGQLSIKPFATGIRIAAKETYFIPRVHSHPRFSLTSSQTYDKLFHQLEKPVERFSYQSHQHEINQPKTKRKSSSQHVSPTNKKLVTSNEELQLMIDDLSRKYDLPSLVASSTHPPSSYASTTEESSTTTLPQLPRHPPVPPVNTSSIVQDFRRQQQLSSRTIPLNSTLSTPQDDMFSRAHHLFHLDKAELYYICLFLNVVDIIRLSSSCRFLYQRLNANVLWKQLYWLHINPYSTTSRHRSWKQTYRSKLLSCRWSRQSKSAYVDLSEFQCTASFRFHEKYRLDEVAPYPIRLRQALPHQGLCEIDFVRQSVFRDNTGIGLSTQYLCYHAIEQLRKPFIIPKDGHRITRHAHETIDLLPSHEQNSIWGSCSNRLGAYVTVKKVAHRSIQFGLQNRRSQNRRLSNTMHLDASYASHHQSPPFHTTSTLPLKKRRSVLLSRHVEGINPLLPSAHALPLFNIGLFSSYILCMGFKIHFGFKIAQGDRVTLRVHRHKRVKFSQMPPLAQAIVVSPTGVGSIQFYVNRKKLAVPFYNCFESIRSSSSKSGSVFVLANIGDGGYRVVDFRKK